MDTVLNRSQQSDKIAALRRSDLFGNLPEELLGEIANLAILRRVRRGQLLFSERQEASGLYIVTRGEIRSVRQSPSGREQVLSTERPGAILGVVPVFNGGKFYSTAIADSVAEVLCIERRAMQRLCREHKEILWNLARLLAHKVRHYAELVELLALQNVDQRVAQYLLMIARDRGATVGQGYTVELTLTRTALASRLGSAREVVSRAFTHLEKSGLIQTQGRRLIHIPNLEALKAFAGAEHSVDQAKVPSDLSSDIA